MHSYASRIVSKERSLMVKGGAYTTGTLIAKFCSFPGARIRVGVVIHHWAVIRSFTVLPVSCGNSRFFLFFMSYSIRPHDTLL